MEEINITSKSNKARDNILIKEKIIIDMKSAVCIAKPITAKEYYDLYQVSLPLFENYDCYFYLDYLLEHKFPDFDRSLLYGALRTLFGESTTMYDDFKCSFGYPFLLKINKKHKKSKYIVNFSDVKGGLDFNFRKILITPEELKKYKDRLKLYQPFEDEFSKEEMAYFMVWFLGYLIGFMELFKKHYKREFARSIDYVFTIYGFKNGRFFVDEYKYEDKNEFYEAKDKLIKAGFPFNEVKPNL